jgi:single-stranded-DNA-specific exonuclease
MLWRFRQNPPEDFIKQFLEYPPKILQLLWNRGLRQQAQIDEFFNPDYKEDLHDPFLMLGVREAVKVIFKAIKRQEPVAIFGDYDADGVCGAVILETVLRALGANSVQVYIPDRHIEGYGLNAAAVEKIAKEGVKLILTVDCGVNDFKEIKLANSLKMEVIVVDHHHISKRLPPARVVIDPHQKNEKYPFSNLAGAGVAFKLAQALARSTKQKMTVKGNENGQTGITDGWEKWLLDLVALATVADCVPLLGENRTLVRYGLYVLAKTRRVGLQELMRVARINPTVNGEELKTNLNTYSLAFVLAPRLNAAARIEHANIAYNLLKTDSFVEATQLAQELDQKNRERQKITDVMVAEIEERIKDKLADKERFVIVEADTKWRVGMVGLAAGKISDKHHRPTVIFFQDGENLRGSARSIEKFNIIEALDECAEFLKEYGGHPGAAGLSLSEKNLADFEACLNKIAKEKLTPEDLLPTLEIDSVLDVDETDWEFFDKLERFEPFGQGNEQPVFALKNLEITGLRYVGNNSKHLKLELKGGKLFDKAFRAIGFNLGKNGASNLQIGDRVDVAFELIADEWNGTRNLQLKIVDIKK